jgi:hypothetical protein
MNCLTNKPTNTETRMSTHLGWANHILTILKKFLRLKKGTTVASMFHDDDTT